jgi:hypothetical protein
MALKKIIWLGEPREIVGIGLIKKGDKVSVSEELAAQLKNQGYAKIQKEKQKEKPKEKKETRHGRAITKSNRSTRIQN